MREEFAVGTISGIERIWDPTHTGNLVNGGGASALVGTLYRDTVGPSLGAINSYGFTGSTGSVSTWHIENQLVAGGSPVASGLYGVWFYFDAFGTGSATGDAIIDLLLMETGTGAVLLEVSIGADGAIHFRGTLTSPSATPIPLPRRQWCWIGIAWVKSGPDNNFTYAMSALYRAPGSTTTTKLGTWATSAFVSATDLYIFTGNYSQGGGAGVVIRLGCPSLYTIDGTAGSVAYPGEIVAPPAGPFTFTVNPSTGDDTADGIVTPWASAARVSLSSQRLGLLPYVNTPLGGTCGTAGLGTTLVIDTSTARLPLGEGTDAGSQLILGTDGLNVIPQMGQTYIDVQAEKFINAGDWTKTGGRTFTYQTPCAGFGTQYLWQDDYPLVRQASVAAVDAAAGSFYTDGTSLYVRPMASTNPASDGSVYTRSQERGLDPAGAGDDTAAVAFCARDQHIKGVKVWKTTRKVNGAYCFGDKGAGVNFGGTILLENFFLKYGDKHVFGLTANANDSRITIQNCQFEQCPGVPIVSFMDQGAHNGHSYIDCTCLAGSMIALSLVGESGNIASSFLTHAGSLAYDFLNFTGCDFTGGLVTDQGSASEQNWVDCDCVRMEINVPVLFDRCRFNYVPLMGQGGTMRNCIVEDTKNYSGAQGLMAGTVLIEFCTFDFSTASGGSGAAVFAPGGITPLLTFRNNAIINMAAGNEVAIVKGMSSSHIAAWDYNIYQQAGTANIALTFNDGGGAASKTFSQWQSDGYDTHGSVTANILLDNTSDYVVETSSPVIAAALAASNYPDFTGTVFVTRNDVGARESNPPSTPSNVAVVQSGSGLSVSWDAVAGATSYKIYRSTTTGTETLYQSGATSPYQDDNM